MGMNRVIRDMVCLERSLDLALDSLKARLHEIRPDTDLSEDAADELDSIASNSTMNAVTAPHRTVRFGVSPREVEALQAKLAMLEKENAGLRNKVVELKTLLGQDIDETNEKAVESNGAVPKNIRSEGGVLKIIRSSLSIS
jgi:regulator of replication initiation timing